MAAAGASSAPEVLSSNVHARAAALELEQEPPAAGKTRQRCCAQLPALCPDSRRRALLGPLFLVAGAWMIASANACAKVLYLHEAVSVASLFLLRSAVVYAMNAMFIVAGVGGAPRSSVVGVLLLRCGSRRTQLLTLLRGLMGTGGIGLLNLAYFNFLTFADAFAIFLGLSTMLTILGARLLLGASERLGWGELGGGAVTVIGILLVTQPSALRRLLLPSDAAPDAAPPSAAGVAIAAGAAALLSAFLLLTRVLTRRGPHGRHHVSPALLLSHYMVVLGAAAVTTLLLLRLAPGPPPAWGRLALPRTAADWLTFIGYSALILLGHLANAHGMRHTPAGPGAILMATELPFAFFIDVALVREPTNGLAAVGVAVIFVGVACATAAQQPAAKATDAAPLRSAAGSGAACGAGAVDRAQEPGHGPEAWVETVERVPGKEGGATASSSTVL